MVHFVHNHSSFFWVSSLYIFAIGVICFFAWTYAKSYFGIYVVPTILIASFHLWQWIQLSLLNSAAFIKNSIFHIFGFEDLKSWDTDIIRYSIAPLTIVLGFAVFAIASLQTESFFTDKYPFGLIVLPSVWFGDLFILPILNRKIYDIFKVYQLSGFFIKRQFLSAVGILTMVSIAIMGYMHYSWTQDEYTGFMDMELGELSFAGWWHLFFSSLEFTIISTALYMGFIGIKQKNILLINTFLKGWKFLIFFSAISFVDLWVRPFSLSIFDVFTLLPFFTTSLIYFYFTKFNKKLTA